MENKNSTYNWWKEKLANKIIIDKEILDWENPIRGIYGIFTREKDYIYCAYVGKANNIYLRFFSSSGNKENTGHLVKIKNGLCTNNKINEALKNEASIIEIKVLEEVKCQYDHYHKDMHRLAFAEYYHISKYQELNQCLEQLPDGSNMDEEVWKIEHDKRHKKIMSKLSVDRATNLDLSNN